MNGIGQTSLLIVWICTFFCFCICLYGLWQVSTANKQDKNRRQREKIIIEQLRQAVDHTPYDTDLETVIAKQIKRLIKKEEALVDLNRALQQIDAGEIPLNLAFQTLIDRFGKKSPIVRGYLAEMAASYGVTTKGVYDFLSDNLQGSAENLRLQILKTASTLSFDQLLLKALKQLNDDQWHLDQKLLVDCLQCYGDEPHKLELLLSDHFDEFHYQVQCAIIDYYQAKTYEEISPVLLKRLLAPNINKEVCIAIIKYFSKITYPPVQSCLLTLADHTVWEYAAIASKALASYPSHGTVIQLKKRLGDKNWYIRYNCAMSLAELCDEDEIMTILKSADPFARDIMTYALNLQQNKWYQSWSKKGEGLCPG